MEISKKAVEVKLFTDLGLVDDHYVSQFELSDGAIIKNYFPAGIESKGLFSVPHMRFEKDKAFLMKYGIQEEKIKLMEHDVREAKIEYMQAKIEYMLKTLTLGVVFEALSESYQKITKEEG